MMPKLPNLVVFAELLNQKFQYQKLQKLDFHSKAKLSAQEKKDLQATFENQLLSEVIREGEQLFFKFLNGKLLLLQLMEGGSLAAYSDLKGVNDLVMSLGFENGMQIGIVAPNKRTKIVLCDHISRLVPDVLSVQFTQLYFEKQAALHPNLSIRTLLLQQSSIKGLDETYVHEILRQANILPDVFCQDMTKEQLETVYHSIRQVLTRAIADLKKYHPAWSAAKMRNFFHDTLNIQLVMGDITKFRVGAIVNAASPSLVGGRGVDAAIHQAAGKALRNECQSWVKRNGNCARGEALITTAGDLAAHYVIHTVGARWQDGYQNESVLLANCYKNSLQLALDHHLKSIAFPNIGTGVYKYPKEEAAQIALDNCIDFVEKYPDSFDKIIFVCFDEENYQVYEQILEIYASSQIKTLFAL